MNIEYENLKPVEMRQREAIAYTLSQIQLGNGFFNTLGDVTFGLEQRFEVDNWNYAVVLNRGGESTFGATEQLETEASYDILVFRKPSESTAETAAEWREKVLCDVRTAFGRSPGLEGEDGRLTARLCRIAGFTPFNKLAEQSFVGIRIQLAVKYAHKVQDGTVFA